jgi:hypothetical protein
MPIRTFALNSPEFHEAVREPRERPWIPNGALPPEPRAWGPAVIAEAHRLTAPPPSAGEGKPERSDGRERGR